ncbi:TetR/AcrR family transcriptional regulator [Turneriella parva]|jgi:AcrR family transcriptional regulator|uniref:Transcriptional regulator, TetR family n=1 Tax=Turneriella parva (strain ATCC BAA-1111 / DSM 21527 / NCTC 11395 / H) TaxID=869212 RepID=I4B9I0_TURPD|nr:TetR/AcrR family transcriptional regulator [Turneriella parva]AFM13937.1 transcriptional regulator, TetR family [Turneriella parva DSM 21527]
MVRDKKGTLPTAPKKRVWNRTAKTRMKILNGAAVAFSARGYYGTSLVELSKRTGAEQASIYYHFQSKENLFKKCLIYTHLMVIRGLRRDLNRTEGLREELVSIFNTLANYSDVYPERIALIFQLVYSAPKTIAVFYTRKYGGNFRSLIEAAFDRNPPKSGRGVKQSLMIDMLYSFILSLSAPAVRNDRRLMAPRAVDFILQDKIHPN